MDNTLINECLMDELQRIIGCYTAWAAGGTVELILFDFDSQCVLILILMMSDMHVSITSLRHLPNHSHVTFTALHHTKIRNHRGELMTSLYLIPLPSTRKHHKRKQNQFGCFDNQYLAYSIVSLRLHLHG